MHHFVVLGDPRAPSDNTAGLTQRASTSWGNSPEKHDALCDTRYSGMPRSYEAGRELESVPRVPHV